MKTLKQINPRAIKVTALCAALTAFVSTGQAQVTFAQVTNGLVDLYPLDIVVTNGTTYTTPDYIGGRDLILNNMNGNNLIPAGHPTLNSASTNLCLNLTQSGGATVLYYNSKGQNPLDGSGDFLPFCNQVNATMNFWIRCTASSGYNDTRFFGEADTTGGQSAPLWLFGTSSSGGLSTDTHAHFLFREDPNGGTSPQTLVDGSKQLPFPGYYWTQGSDYTATNPLDGDWHMMTVVIESNRVMDIFIDGVRDPGPGAVGGTVYTDQNGNPNYGPDMPLTNLYYTTNIYPSAGVSNPPPNGFVRWMWNATFKTGSTVFGGFKRGSVTAGIPCQYDDIAFWNRELSTNEILFVYTNGLPGIQLSRPLIINSFTADFPEIGSGDTVTLHWNVVGANTNANSGGIVISGVGDVSALGLIGSTKVTLTGNQTYNFTLTAHNGVAPNQTASVSVLSFPGVDPNWHLIQRFDGVFSPTTTGINGDGWVSVESSYSANFDRWNVFPVTNSGAINEVLTPQTGYNPDASAITGFEAEGAMSYTLLNGLTMPPGQSNTLFFRFSLQDPPVGTPSGTIYSDLDFGVGLTDYTPITPSGGLGYYGGTGGGLGPYFSILRNSGGAFTGGPFDLFAPDYGGSSTTNTFSYIASVDPNGLQTNVNYYVWMDVANYNTQAYTNTSTGTSNTINEAVYSVWIQKQGDPARTNLFSGFHGNRDYIDFNPVNDNPTPYLSKIFLNIGNESLVNLQGGAYIATNMIAIDDIYLSKSGFDSSIPRQFNITSIVRSAGGVTLNWESLGSIYQTNTYTILRKSNLTDPAWTTLGTVPSGGATTTYVDTTVGAKSSAYYRISSP